MAQIELNILRRQGLDRRIDNADALNREVAAWEAKRSETPPNRRQIGDSRRTTPE